MCICIRTSIDVYISLFFPSNNYRIFNTDRFNREKSRCIKIVLRYSSTIFRAIFFPLAEEIDVWIESFTFRDTSMFGGVGRGGEGKNKNRRPIESGAINGSRHCSPRFQVKFARIKNGAIVYRNSLFVFFFFHVLRDTFGKSFLLSFWSIFNRHFYLDNWSNPIFWILFARGRKFYRIIGLKSLRLRE